MYTSINLWTCSHLEYALSFHSMKIFGNKAEKDTPLIESHSYEENYWIHCRGIKIKLCDDCVIQEASVWPSDLEIVAIW